MNSFTSRTVPLAFIIIFSCITWGSQYFVRDLWEPDEPRYTYVAWEMAETGNFLVPQRNGEFYAHKPPLMFWLIQISTVFTKGVFNGISGRLPTLLGVVLSLWAMTRIAAMWFDRKTAWYAFFITSTSFLFWHKAGTGQIDMLLLGLETASLYLLLKNDESPRRLYPIIAFSLMGLAVLAKGPVGIIVPCGIYITGSILSGQTKRIKKKQWVWGPLLALSWPLTWLLLAKINGAPHEYFNELLFTQNVGRVKGDFGGHYRPFYYYLKYLFLDFLPWTFFLPGAILLIKRYPLWKQHTAFLLGWIVFVVVFFSLCGGKRNLYILSVYPAASLLLAAALPRMTYLSHKWKTGISGSVTALFGLLSISLLIVSLFIPLPVSKGIFIPGAAILMLGSFLLYSIPGKYSLNHDWFTLFIIFMIALEFYGGVFIMPAFNDLKTPVDEAVLIQKNIPEDRKILYYQMDGEIISLYGKRVGMRFDHWKSLKEEMKKTGTGMVFFNEKKWENLKYELHDTGKLHFFSIGNKKLGCLTYKAIF